MEKIKTLIIISLIVVIIWIGSPFLISMFFPELSERASLGDSFGTINSLFSGLAFAGIIYTILLQKNELALQREELKLTREELYRSADAQEMSQKALQGQFDAMQFSSRLTALDTLNSTYIKRKKESTDSLKRADYHQKAIVVQDEIIRMTYDFAKK